MKNDTSASTSSTPVPYHYRPAAAVEAKPQAVAAPGREASAVPVPAAAATPAAAILLVDDDTELLDLLRNYLEREGFAVGTANDGIAGVEAALSGRYAIAVIDVMMPRLNGIETLKRIRATSSLPVLMLTAKGDDTDRIIGLEIGADDYVPKPCTPRELTARIRAILRRLHPADPGAGVDPAIVAGALSVSSARRSAHWNGQPVSLTSTEFNLLEVLARNVGKPVSKKALSEQALGRALTPFDRSIDVHMSSIRQKLGHIADGRSCIQTVYRQGYQLICD
jgi:two-component system OmpR family response regulator/two-component system response regulator CpxR